MFYSYLKKIIRHYLPTSDSNVFWNERVRQYGKRAVLNIGHSEEQYDAVTLRQKNEIFPHLKKMLKGNDKVVLDFGCGPGRFSHDLAQLVGGKTIAVDPIKQLLDLAPTYPDVEYQQIIRNKIPLADQTCDVVWVCLVLGGLEGAVLKAAIFEIQRVLKSQGLLFLVENTEEKASQSHWFFRTLEQYRKLFPTLNLDLLHNYEDLGEKISIMSGRKR